MVVTLVCSIIGLVVIWLGYRAYRKDRAERQRLSRWSTALGRLEEARIETVRVRDSEGGTETGFVPIATYRFTVDGVDHHGTRVRQSGTSFATRAEAERWRDAHPAGTAVEVHYNPANPADCALEVDLVAPWRSLAVLGLCVAVGVWFIIIGVSI